MQKIRGLIVPVLTPFLADETIHEQALRDQIERMIAAGVHGIFPLGTTGEAYILSEAEKEAILEISVDQVRRRVPVYAGTGCISTRDTIRLSRRAAQIGADVLSVITPSFVAASQNELYEHYKAVAQSVDLPILLYNIPARTGNALTPATVERLSHIENIAGAKDSSGSFDNILQYIERTKERDFVVLSGNDSLILWTLLAGGTGGIAGCANVCPKTLVAIYDRYIAGDLEGARQAQDSIRVLRDCFKFGNSNAVIKAAMEMLEYPVGKCRAPFHLLSDEAVAAVRGALDEMAAKGVC